MKVRILKVGVISFSSYEKRLASRNGDAHKDCADAGMLAIIRRASCMHYTSTSQMCNVLSFSSVNKQATRKGLKLAPLLAC